MATSETTTEETLQLYNNPLLIQTKQLELFENYLFDGRTILDGNNVFTFGLEMGATMTANIVSEMTNSFQSLYPARAQTMSDLYRHLSDYDYIDLYSSPANTTLELMLDRDYLINNAPVDTDDTVYNKIEIPSFSTFTVGDHTFGIHYPIQIRIRKAYKADGVTVDHNNCLFQCVWDTSTTNPLYTLTNNVLEHRTYQREGITLFCISIPVYQFAIATYTDDSISSTGFIQRYPYSNRFYAIRVFHYSGGEWVELAETLSDVVYNPSIPTAKVSVLTDMHVVEVSIPQVYFTNNLIGNKVMCLIYTTEGAIDVDISSYSTDQFSASFLMDDKVADDTYSAFLKRVPLMYVLPLSSRISSGTNGKTFNEMKNRVINSVGGDDLLVTVAQLTAHLSDIGFEVSRYIDNITDRIYLASKSITDSNSNIVASGEYKTTVTDYMLANADGEYDTIKTIVAPSGVNSYGEYMIMPNTLFKYDSATDSMIPQSMYETKALLSTATTTEMITLLNNNTYTFTPFHVKLSATKDLPMAGIYDLTDPSVSNVTFVQENTATNTQVSMLGQYLTHREYGTNGYRLLVALYKTDDLSDVSVYDDITATEKIVVILKTLNNEQVPVYVKGDYYGQNSSGKDLIKFDLTTDYKILSTNVIDITSMQTIDEYSTTSVSTYIPLDNEYELMFFAHKDLINSDTAEYVSNTVADIPKEVTALNMVWLATQSMDIKLGESISSLLANTYVTIEGEEYTTYDTTTYSTYYSDVYDRYTADEIDAETGETHYAGDLKLNVDEDGNYQPTVTATAGSVIIASDDTTIGEKGPAFTIVEYGDDDTVVKSEILYMDTTNMTANADVTNVWMPYYLYNESDDVWKGIYTGGYDVSALGEYTPTEASIVEVKDYMKIMIDGHTEVATHGDLSRSYESETIDGVTTYTVGELPATRFIYVKDDSDNKDMSTYQLMTQDGVLGLYSSATNNRDAEWGAMYVKDTDKATFDYTTYLTTSELGEFYARYDALVDQYNTDVTTTTAYSELLSEFQIDTVKATALLDYRTPWVKVLETTVDNVASISEYWNNRSLLNFDSTLSIQGMDGDYVGVLGLNYIQYRSTNSNTILQYTDQDEATTQANTGNDYRLIWISPYDPEKDTSAINSTPLVGSLDIPTNGTMGAMLWGASRDSSRHYVIATGATFEACYNEIMKHNTYSGLVYECAVKDTSTFNLTVNETHGILELADITAETKDDAAVKCATLFKDIEDNVTVYMAVLNDELNFTKVDWTSSEYWPWEVTGWTNLAGYTIAELGTTISLSTTYSDAKILHLQGDVMVDSSGTPVTTSDVDVRKLMYHVNMVHCDYKPLESTDEDYESYRTSIQELLRSYFEALEATQPLLLERTELYYTPINSMGSGVFKGADGDTITHDLEITVSLKLYVTSTTAGDDDTKELIENNILTLVETHMEDGSINCADLANEIKTSMSDSVLYVDILGINGDTSTQTLITDDPSQSAVRLKTLLVLNEDNTISVEKGLDITWAIIN